MYISTFRAVVISVSDLQRSLAFYRDLLGLAVIEQRQGETILDAGAGHRLILVTSPNPRPSRWIGDDLQTGLRHAAFKVRDVDATAAHLKAANVPFTLDPLDATGGVRIAFFTDPDGALLEIVQGELQYHQRGEAADQMTAIVPQGDTLIFDHVAVTVSNLDAAMAFYSGELGCPVIGQLFFNDARGFIITYLKAGDAVLELFSFSAPTQPNYHDPDLAVTGLKYPVFEADTARSTITAPDGVQIALIPIGEQA